MSDLKNTILQAKDRPYEDRDVEEWGVTVRVRGLSGSAAESFSRRYGDLEDGEVPDGIMVELLVRTLESPETGERIFAPEDTAALSAKSAKVLTDLFTLAQRLSGLGELDDAKND